MNVIWMVVNRHGDDDREDRHDDPVLAARSVSCSI